MQIRKTFSGSLRLEQRLRVLVAMLIMLSGLGFFGSFAPAPAKAATPLDFSNDAFKATWQRTDYPIATGKAPRSWYWGPSPDSIGIFEKYADSPTGQREVQYYDKARMEINNPQKNQVTNGLLVVEMITGRLQLGDNTFQQQTPAAIAIAGDPTNTFPTFASLGGVYLKPQGMEVGKTVMNSWMPAGLGVGQQTNYKNDPGTVIATKQNGLGIPAAFWNFLNQTGQVYTNGTYQNDTISNWLFSTGLPLTEAYWTQVKVGGKVQDVMFQAFERRTLTYTPSNPAEFRVEMGNVGLEYVSWRYPKGLPQVQNPSALPFVNSTATWYTVTADALNIRTAPNTSAPPPERTQTKPFLQQLVKGNHIQPIRSVTGEEIEKGNNVWYQFYESPDLFVYSGYVQKMTLPDYATPPRTHPGVWVSVDLTKQMMAVYENSRLIYKTLIASGVPNDSDPDKDHRTPVGVYKINGSYRPKSQTMEGGEGDKAAGGDYYKLEDIRNVSYFFEDYSIHGTYWHARFGTYPQSHGCVNSTVYDAGLIYALPAGTIVDVFREGGATATRAEW